MEDSLRDLVKEAEAYSDNVANRIAKYTREFILSPERIAINEYVLSSLTWDSVRYAAEQEIDKIPDNKRGVYAFSICQPSEILPPHGYILYIGIAGRDSNRSLRERYKDYLQKSHIRKRSKIYFMIGTWSEVLRFFFAPVEENVSSDELKTLEKQLNTALMPPLSQKDLEAEIKEMKRAFA